MVDSRRNTSSGIFVLILMIVFFSFFQREKDKHNETIQSVISSSNSSYLQAIMVPEISGPGTDLFWIKKLNSKFTYFDVNSTRELVLNELISSKYNSHQLEFHFNNPVIGLIFPQKVPELGNDDVPSIT
jgi:hypothetical protein